MNLALAPSHSPERNPDWMTALTVTRVHVELVPERTWRLPRDPEVTLRGALGSAMFELLCLRPSPSCQGCPHAGSCLIPAWYEPGRLGSAAPRPLALRLRQPGGHVLKDALHVELLLFGELPRSGLLIEALIRAGQSGLGAARVPHQVRRLLVHGEGWPVCVVRDGRPVGTWPASGRLWDFAVTPASVRGANVHLLSPTYWRGVSRSRPPTAGELIAAALGRVRKLARSQDTSLSRWWPKADALLGDWIDPRWRPRARYSKRQGQSVSLAGWTGTVVQGPEVAPYVDLLAAAEVLGVGKGATAGAGRVEVEWLA